VGNTIAQHRSNERYSPSPVPRPLSTAQYFLSSAPDAILLDTATGAKKSFQLSQLQGPSLVNC